MIVVPFTTPYYARPKHVRLRFPEKSHISDNNPSSKTPLEKEAPMIDAN